jgi:hypothetical protein
MQSDFNGTVGGQCDASDVIACSFAGLMLEENFIQDASECGKRVPDGHTPFSWGILSRGTVPGEKGRTGGHVFHEWPPPAGSLLQCVVAVTAGSVDWSSNSTGPPCFRTRRRLTLADLPGITLLGHGDFPRRRDHSGHEHEHCHPPFATWWMHVASAGEGKLRFSLESAFTRRFLCSDDNGVLSTAGHNDLECLWEMPVAALRPICGLPCKVRQVAHERYLALEVSDAPDNAAPSKRRHVSLRTTRERKACCELIFNSVLAGPTPPQLWGWDALSLKHGVQGGDGGGACGVGPWSKEGAKDGWLMMVRHGLSVANVQKDTFKGTCDERYIDAPLSPQGRRQAEGLWRVVAAYNPTLIVVSPMRRALQTCLIALDPAPRAPDMIALPVLLEGAGDGLENQGRFVEELAGDVELQCYTHWNRVCMLNQTHEFCMHL